MDAPIELLGLARDVAAEAGALLRARLPATPGALLRSGRATAKSSPTDLVTDIDRSSEALIVAKLLAARPDDGIHGEEGSSRESASGVTWVVDPLDGTINYLYGIPVFAVSIAASVGGRNVLGVVHNPMTGEMFAAAEGAGAWLNDLQLRLEPTGIPLAEALVGTGFSYGSQRRAAQARLIPEIVPAVRDIRRAGAAALDLCAVACGRLDAYYEAGLADWDVAAGEVIVREAGGTVIELEDLFPGSATVVAAAPGLEDRLVGLLRRAAAT